MTAQQLIKQIIEATGSKAAAARELSVDVKTIDNWKKIEDPKRPRDKRLVRYLEGILKELNEG